MATFRDEVLDFGGQDGEPLVSITMRSRLRDDETMSSRRADLTGLVFWAASKVSRFLLPLQLLCSQQRIHPLHPTPPPEEAPPPWTPAMARPCHSLRQYQLAVFCCKDDGKVAGSEAL